MLKINKSSFSVSEAMLILWTSPNKQVSSDLKVKLHTLRKILHESELVKYLGFQIDNCLKLKEQVNNVVFKLNKFNAILSKLRHGFNKKVQSEPAL